MRIKNVFPCDRGWQVAVKDTESDGAVFFPVVTMAIVECGLDGDQVVALCVDYEERSGELVASNAFGDRFLGLAEPHSDLSHWHDVAKSEADAERTVENREELGRRAGKMIAGCSHENLITLAEIADSPKADAFFAASCIVDLVKKECIHFHDGVGWRLTSLGDALFRWLKEEPRFKATNEVPPPPTTSSERSDEPDEPVVETDDGLPPF